ncbi:MAG: putative sulfate/molybdate transporter [Alphaproteobacteria bacterium]
MAMRIQRAERRQAGDIGGAFGDLGVLLPYVVGAVTVAGLAPAGILLGFGLFLVASGLFYALPMAVQPMKVVGAMLLTGELDAAAVAATGLVMGVVLLTLAATGAIGRLARLIPSSVGAGLQLGIGLAMALFGFTLMDGALWFGVLVLFVLFGLMRVPRCPAAPLTILLAIACGVAIGDVAMPDWPAGGLALPGFALPEPASFWPALENAVLPQLPLTLTNAVIVTAALAHSLYPERAARATPRNLLLTTGLANLVLAPFGALPMCHGAGGVQAQHRISLRARRHRKKQVAGTRERSFDVRHWRRPVEMERLDARCPELLAFGIAAHRRANRPTGRHETVRQHPSAIPQAEHE